MESEAAIRLDKLSAQPVPEASTARTAHTKAEKQTLAAPPFHSLIRGWSGKCSRESDVVAVAVGEIFAEKSQASYFGISPGGSVKAMACAGIDLHFVGNVLALQELF